MNPINTDHFKKEIEYNLAIMEQTLESGVSVDFGFLDIFENDIAELGKKLAQENPQVESSKLIVNDLSFRLQQDAARLHSIAGGTLQFDDVSSPLVATGTTKASEMVSAYSAGNGRAGMEILAQNNIDIRKVKGDGHCLFRSIAAIDLFDAEKKKVKSKIQVLATTVSTSNAYANVLQVKAKKVVELLDSKEQSEAGKILGSPEASDLLVEFLRLIASEYTKKNRSETLDNMLFLDCITLEEYCDNMADMSKTEMGGEPEIIALEQELGTKFRILNLESLGLKTETLPSKEELFQGSRFLLKRGGHYDLAEVVGS